jgi:hypothetical protein
MGMGDEGRRREPLASWPGERGSSLCSEGRGRTEYSTSIVSCSSCNCSSFSTIASIYSSLRASYCSWVMFAGEGVGSAGFGAGVGFSDSGDRPFCAIGVELKARTGVEGEGNKRAGRRVRRRLKGEGRSVGLTLKAEEERVARKSLKREVRDDIVKL